MELNEDQLNNALSIADFHAPMTPVMRAVEYPSMNKDGVPFGTMIGVAAVLETIAGTTGKTNLLELDKYDYLGDDLGSNYEIMNLYFKPYTCCRWAHPPIDAALSLIKKHRINSNLISEINVFTFLAATRLSKIYPESTDEAQYNISFPIAAAIVDGDLGFTQVIDENLNRKEVIEIMDKINYFVDEEIESKFPQERLCKVEIKTKNGESFMSDIFGPRGEAKDNVDLSWIVKKFKRRTTFFLNDEQQDEIIAMLTNLEHLSMRKVIETINSISRV